MRYLGVHYACGYYFSVLLTSCEETPPIEESVERVDVETTVVRQPKVEEEIQADSSEQVSLISTNESAVIEPGTFETAVDFTLEAVGDTGHGKPIQQQNCGL